MLPDAHDATGSEIAAALPIRENTVLDDDVPYNSSIGLFLTKRCPLRCAHCLVGSSPEHHDPPAADVLRWAQALARAASLTHVCITGGDPFITRGLLRRVVTLLTQAEKQVSVITSAFWATTPDKARATLRSVFAAGTPVRLWISLDPYHSEFLSRRHYCAAIHAASALAIPVCVTATYTRDPHEALDFIHSTIDDPEAWRRIAKVRVQPLFRVGRASSVGHAAPATRRLPRGRCGTCVGHVDAAGRVTACCSVFDAVEENPLHLGRLDANDIDTLLARGSRDWLVQTVRTFGPAYLAEVAAAVLPADVFQRDYLPHDICALCSAIMQSPAAVALLRRRFARDAALRRKVALLRDVLYGETDSLLQLNEQ